METITQKIFELLSEGSNIEERRSREIISKSNWFDAIDAGATETTPKGKGNKDDDSGIVQKRRFTNLNDIP